MLEDICFFSSTRATSHLMHPVIKKMLKRDMTVNVIVTGSHLDERFEESSDEFEYLDSNNVHRFSFLDEATDIPTQNALVLNQVNELLSDISPDGFYVDGDRYEAFAATQSAFFNRIPILHAGGGNITSGGCFDDSLRHAISRLAHLHFTTCEPARENLLSMGEEPWRVHNVGNPYLDFVKNTELFSKNELNQMFDVDLERPYVLFTMHPVPGEDYYDFTRKLIDRLTEDYVVFASYPNFDPGHKVIIEALEEAEEDPNVVLEKSFGMKRYLSLMKYCRFVCGNSSSLINETVYFEKYGILCGDRQDDRIRSNNIVKITSPEQLGEAIEELRTREQTNEPIRNIFGDGRAGENIITALKELNRGNDELFEKSYKFNS